MNIYLSKQHPSYYQNLPHLMKDRTPYTYLIGWSQHNKWYYGSRYGKNCHPKDLFNPYKTSSAVVKSFIAAHGFPDIIQVRQIFSSTVKSKNFEDSVLKS